MRGNSGFKHQRVRVEKIREMTLGWRKGSDGRGEWKSRAALGDMGHSGHT